MADTDELYAKAKHANALKKLMRVATVLIAAPALFALSSALLNDGLYEPFSYLFIGAVTVLFVTPSVYGFVANFMQNRRKFQAKMPKISSLASLPPS